MNVTKKVAAPTYSITDITEDQAYDLLSIAHNWRLDSTRDTPQARSELETLTNIRQALLSVGVTLKNEGAN